MHRSPGFTLIELLVVLAIVALLLTIALPRYSASVERSKDTVLRENLRNIRLSIEQFDADRGRLPHTLTDLVEHRYLREVPVDPVTGSADTWQVQMSTELGKQGIVGVHSGAAGEDRLGRAYAEY